MANIFQGISKEAQCVRAWDEQLRSSEWVDTDVFADIFDFSHIRYEEQESYRKAIRFMKQAEKFNRPVITFVDTKGAYPGIGAEERGQGEAIARSMFEMARLKVPVIAIIIGEGSSGGALALGVANKVLMLENAVYSILSPEGYSSILWKDSSRYKEAAEKMKLTAGDLYDLNVIDKVIKESYKVNDEEFKNICDNIKKEIKSSINKLKKLSEEEIVENRYQKFRKIGEFVTLN